jgi:DNA topoisomerase-1
MKEKDKKTLLLVESPHKAKTIQSLLGDDYIVLASAGHILSLSKSGKDNLGIDIDNSFKPKFILDDDHIQILQNILNAAQECKEVIILSDPDREGWVIASHLKERLEGIDVPIRRGVFNKITKKEILTAIKNAGDIDENIVSSGIARRLLDRIVGFTSSPFLMRFFGNSLSAGRVQSPVVRLIIDREREIESFIPQDYFTINVSLFKGEVAFTTKYAGKLTDEQSAFSMKERLSKDEYVISSVISSEEAVKPPPPLITASLQKLMSKKYGIEAADTMKAAQSLYEAGHISYIRTDSIRISDETIEEAREYLSKNNFPIPKKSNIYENKELAQNAHEAIHPTNISLNPNETSFSNPIETKVYDMVWRYFLASQSASAIYNTLKVIASPIGDKATEVRASGKAIKENGFLSILSISDKSEITIPSLKKGETVYLCDDGISLEKKKTQPLPRYSEYKLLDEIERRGIGRPSTFADLLSKITSRGYVIKKDNIYFPTELGKKITDILTDSFSFLDYDYTKNMENKLDDIENGKVDKVSMLTEFWEPFKKELNAAYLKQGALICEECGSPMVKRTIKKTGETAICCTNLPQCWNKKTIENN